MNQDNFGSLIKNIRKKHNLTQKDLAEKYNVTYQAVSKWENGKNMPDTYLIKKISEDFNISLENIFEGKINSKKRYKKVFFISLGIIIIIIITVVFLLMKNNDFEFKTLSSDCKDFSISGSISYNDNKSSIYITNIKYCGDDNNKEYEKIECILYESNEEIDKKISSYIYNETKITLTDFLNKVTLSIDDYKNNCKKYSDDTLFLSINAFNGKEITSFKIPLSLDDSCQKLN